MATNPPYGERLAPAKLDEIYRDVGRAFERLGGWRVIVLSGNPAFLRRHPTQARRHAPALERRRSRCGFCGMT